VGKASGGLTDVGEAWKLTAGSPQINKAVGTFDFVTTDFEGNPGSGLKDVGAYEHTG
jgi:hypothetical protein